MDPFALADAVDAIMGAGVTIRMRGRQPAVVGAAPPDLVPKLAGVRQQLVDLLLAGVGAHLEGLVCSKCKSPPDGTPAAYVRYCDEHHLERFWDTRL